MFFDSRSHHVPLQPFCYACQSTIFPHEEFRALLSNEDSTALEGWLGPYPFPPPGMQPPMKYIFCRKPRCSVCARSPETFAFHCVCLVLFHERYKNISSLWTLAIRNRPWRGARVSRYISKSSLLQSFSDKAAEFGMPPMRKMPPEIMSIILSFCQESLLARLASVVSVVNHLSKCQITTKTIVRLVELGPWERGGSIECVEWPKDAVIRLGIDDRGIKFIDRYGTDEASNSIVVGCQSYVIESYKDLASVLATIENGRLRLSLPPPRTWDIPRPPSIAACEFFTPPHGSGQFRTLEISKLTGITFFSRSGRIYGIHGHTVSQPSALQEYERLPLKHRDKHVWIYIPLKGLQAIGLLGPSSLIISSNSSICHVGEPARHGDLHILARIPTLLIIEEPFPREAIPSIGLYGGRDRTLLRTLVHFPSQMYESSASLDNVQVVSIFYDIHRVYVRGILFSYSHGGQQAIGECRVKVAREEKIYSPEFLFYRISHGYGSERFLVGHAAEISDPSEWTRLEMVGKIKMWCNEEYVSHIDRIDA